MNVFKEHLAVIVGCKSGLSIIFSCIVCFFRIHPSICCAVLNPDASFKVIFAL